jgi:hypothetical protein
LAAVGLFLLGRSVGAADLPGLDADRAGRSVVVPIETSVRLIEPPPDPAQGPEAPDDAKPVASETRGFFSTLAHNLVDDVKHVPRRNSYPVAPVAGPDFLGVSVSWR